MQMRLIWISHCGSAVWIIVESFFGWISSDYILLGKIYKTTNVFSCQNGKMKKQNKKTEFNKEKFLGSQMKGEMHGHVKGLVSVDSERHVWKIHSDKSTDHSSLLYFLLGSVPTPALTLALSLPFFISLSFFLPFHSHPFKTTTHYVVPSDNASPNLTLHLGLQYLQFTSDTQAQSLFCALDYTAEANTASGPPSWKWFYSFNIISLNNDSVATWRGCR